MIDFLFDGPEDADHTLALAHGAGAGMRSPFLDYFAYALGAHDIRVARFEFPYLANFRKTGQKRPPDREPVLRQTWLDAVQQLGAKRIVVGGKSMGGRIASLIADTIDAAGLVCLGYPFHPVGKPDTLRIEHLRTLRTPTLILQGTRDPFGTRDEVATYPLSAQVRMHWLEDGEHSFKPRKSSGRTEEQNWREAVEQIAAFVRA